MSFALHTVLRCRAVWGDSGLGDNVPTAVLLQAGASAPVFTYVTPGSNFGLDVIVGEQVCIGGSSNPVGMHSSLLASVRCSR